MSSATSAEVRYPETFSDKAELVDWYKRHQFFHSRLARLVAHYLEVQIDEYFKSPNLPVVARITHRSKKAASLLKNFERKPERYLMQDDLRREGGQPRVSREKVGDLAGALATYYLALFEEEVARRSTASEAASIYVNGDPKGKTTWIFR